MAAESSRRSRNWVFTMNNPGLPEVEAIRAIKLASRWMIIGNERGEVCGTHHFQGFVMFKNAVRFSTVRELCSTAHWEVARGTWEENKVYCSKSGDFITYGTEPATLKRKGEAGAEAEKQRWRHMRELAAVDDFDTLEDEYPREATLYEPQFKRIAIKKAPVQDLAAGTKVGTWIYGPPGTGKTYYAVHSIVPRSSVYLKDLDKWWDGYDQRVHKLVVLDDMDPFHKGLAREIKIWTQEYAVNAQVKGGYMNIRPQQVVVTSNYRIHEIWEDRVTQETMYRRFRCLKKMTYEDAPEEDDDQPGQNWVLPSRRSFVR